MADDGVLHVRHLDQLVGTLTRGRRGGLTFEYAEEWIAGQGSFALAIDLPLERGARQTSFFGNLLPEAGARDRIARKAGITPENDFEFLRLFGADCAGSLEIVDPSGPPTHPDGDVLLLVDDDGKKLATRTGFAELYAEGRRVRLSLAGAQPKLAVVRTPEGGLGVPLDGRPSTHLLKLPNPDYKGLVENEAVVLGLAQRLGLPVVEHEVFTLGNTNLLLVGRYDRSLMGKQVFRLHQQDLCQATGLPPDQKYEKEGGPSFKQVFDIVRRETTDPITASTELLRWAVFNVLVHNADAHAKNVSILRNPNGTQNLAPFYDLVCTGAYKALSHELAMAVGGQFDPGAIGRNHWTQFASDIDVGKSLVLRLVEELASKIPDALSDQLGETTSHTGKIPRRQQLETTIRHRAEKTMAMLAG